MRNIITQTLFTIIIFFSVTYYGVSQIGEPWHYFCKSEKILTFAEADNILWVGCYNGLAEYSKTTQEIQVHNMANSSLLSNHIISIDSDNSNTLWVVTYDGKINSFSNGIWQAMETLNNLSFLYTDVLVDNSNKKWFFAGSSVVVYENNNWNTISFNTADLSCGFISQDGSIWIGGASELIKVNGPDTSYFCSGLPAGYINAISEDSQNNIWFNKGDNLVKFDQVSFTVYNETNSDIINKRIKSVDVTSDDKIVMGTLKYWYNGENHLGGLQIFDGINWTLYNESNSSISSNSVNKIVVDENDIIWTGTLTDLYKFEQNVFEQVFISNSELPNNYIKDMTSYPFGLSYFATEAGVIGYDWNYWSEVIDFNADVICHNPENGDLWMATNYKIARYKDGEIEEYTTPYNHENMNDAGGMIVDADGYVWLGYSSWAEWDPMNGWQEIPGGVYRFKGNFWVDYNSFNSVITRQPKSISVDDNNTIWFSNGHGITKKDGPTWTTYNSENSNLPYYCCNLTLVDHNNFVWTTAGLTDLAVYDGIEWTIHESGNQLSSSLYSLAEDSYGNIWGIGSSKLVKYDGNTWTVFEEPDFPIPYNTPKFLGIDSYDNIFAGSWGITVHNENGIYVYIDDIKTDSLNQIVDVFPNPGSKKVTLRIETKLNYQDLTIDIYDISGRSLKVQTNSYLKNNCYYIDLEIKNLPSGEYIYKLVSENIQHSGKFMVVK